MKFSKHINTDKVYFDPERLIVQKIAMNITGIILSLIPKIQIVLK